MQFDFDFLKIKTGAGSVEDYINNPLNFGKSEAGAQILRGITGYTDDTDLAIFDILIGIYRLLKGEKNEKTQNNFRDNTVGENV